MRRSIYCFGIIIIILLSSNRPSHGQDAGVLYLPDEMHKISPETHICGTTILLNIPEVIESQVGFLNRQSEELYASGQTTEAEVGEKRDFHVYNFDESNDLIQHYDQITFELRKAGDLAEIWVEEDELGEGKISQDVVDAVMNALENQTPPGSFDPDRGIIDINQELFGDAPDVDGSGRVKVLLADIQDGWDPNTGGGFIAGFFNPTDLSNVHPNSNQSDIIYIDTYPGIYRDNQPPNPQRPLNVVAHEYQHLIHANYGNLIVFQNEAQSEVAEVLNGFSARAMSFLDDKDEISGNVETDDVSGLYRWRRSDINTVLLDYQRAGLLHGYLNERVGPEATGSVTRSSRSGKSAYRNALESVDLEWADFLAEFYVANLINNSAFNGGHFGYHMAVFSTVNVTGFGAVYSSFEGRTLDEKEVTLTYGGAKYTLWEDPEDLKLSLSNSNHISYYAVARTAGNTRVYDLDSGTVKFSGYYDSIVLVAVNTLEQEGNEENPGTRSYTYSTGKDVIADRVIEIVDEYELTGNYPNPFNPSTTIEYRLPQASHVRIDVYNISGQKITTLVNDSRAEGTHREPFRANGLASGLYIYRLQAGDFVDAGKMLFVK